MCSLTTPSGRRRDGSPAAPRHLRALRVAADSPSRFLRTAQPSLCRDCGNRIDWYTRTHGRPIGLHPEPLTPQLAELRRRLALRTRRLLDTGAFTPPWPSDSPAPEPVCRPARPVVQILYGRYLAARPVDDIRCVAQTRRRHRCPQRVLAPDMPAGVWTLMPATAIRGQLALPAADMAVYDLTHLPYAEQLRWRTQRCPAHAAPAAPDLALADWEIFDPLLHHQHIHPRLPATAPGRTGNGRERSLQPGHPAG